MLNTLNIHIMANAAHGPTLSGGDRIFIECARRWAKAGHKVHVYVWEDGYEMCKRNKLENVEYILWPAAHYKPLNSAVFHIILIIKCVIEAFRIRSLATYENTVIYSSSDFWMNSLPAFILRMRFKTAKWIAGFYLFAPRPFSRDSPYRGRRVLLGLTYYIYQWPVYYLIKSCADMVWVTNEFDRWQFIDGERLTSEKVMAVRGGVDTRAPALIPEPRTREFSAVFIGRFHPQKGVLELIDIWRYVCEKKKDAKLTMIGIGDLENEVVKRIRKYGLENNIVLLGFRDGVEKLKIFKNSKVVVHPAIYDSGGMAPCEAMSCGLPGVSFDLPALRTYYPKGMLKTPCYDLEKFADNILSLLEDKQLYEKLSREAFGLAQEWDWDKRAEELLEAMKRL